MGMSAGAALPSPSRLFEAKLRVERPVSLRGLQTRPRLVEVNASGRMGMVLLRESPLSEPPI